MILPELRRRKGNRMMNRTLQAPVHPRMAARPRPDLLLGRHDAEVHDTELARCGTGA